MSGLFRFIGRVRFLLVVSALLAGLTVLPGGTAHVLAASSLYVAPTGNDANSCLSADTACRTINAALVKAAAGDTINIAAGAYLETVRLRLGVTLSGAGAQSTVITAATGVEVLSNFDRSGTTRISNLTLAGGRSGGGGGIANYGTMIVANSIIRDNTTWLGEGIQGFGAGIYNGGNLTLINSMVTDNSAVGAPGYPERSGLGGGIYNGGTLTLTESTVSGNTSNRGAGVYNAGTLTVTNSTISGNSAKLDGGGIYSSSAGVTSMNATTIAGNVADSDGNGSGDGGGIASVSGGTSTLKNTLLGDNRDAGGEAPDCAGTLTSNGHNLIETLTGCTVAGEEDGNVTGQDPRLGPLQDNGGPTLTQALLAGSPAIDAGDPATCPATDQRGVERPQGQACDIGAYEAETVAEEPATCPCSIWSDGAHPALEEDPDAVPVELGVKFRSTLDGYITGLRFYKGVNNSGEHIGNLWTHDGKLLARAIFRNETEEGWQTLSFATPVLIRANTTYIASYHTNVGHYAVDEGYFDEHGTTNGPLQALADGEDNGNGVYKYGATGFPAETYRSSNYWVDVVFQTGVTPAVVDLGTLGGDYSAAAAINSEGQVVGSSSTAPGQIANGDGTHAFLWKDGRMTDLGTLPGGGNSHALAINNRGQVVGDSTTAHGERHAVLWAPSGNIVDLGTLGGAFAVATGINDQGVVVGYSMTEASTLLHAFVWKQEVMTDLGTLGGPSSTATGINNRGDIVGYSQSANGETHAVVWRQGKIRDLGGLPGSVPSPGTGLLSQGLAINDRGAIVGWGLTTTGSSAFMWRRGKFTALEGLGGASSRATSISLRGEIVGESTTGKGSTHAARWIDGLARDLATLGGADSSATNINKWGVVVGRSTTATGETHATMWPK